MDIDIKINGKSLQSLLNEVKRLRTDVDALNKSGLDNLNKDVETFNENINETTEATSSLRTQLRQITQELQGLEPGTERFNELSIKAGQLRDTIQDTNAVINATAGSAVENLGTGLSGVAQVGISAFQGIASAQALFGVESEKLQETLVRLQALAGLSDAIKSLGGIKDTYVAVKASLVALTSQLGLYKTAQTGAAVATGVQTTATETATVAQIKLNLAMLANPVFLLIAGITALTAGLYLYSESTKTADEDLKKFNSTIEDNNQAYERGFERINRAQQNRIDLLKSKGAEEKQILDEEIIAIRQQEAQRKVEIDNITTDIKEFKRIYNQAIEEGDNETALQAKKEITRLRKDRQDRKDLEGQYLIDIEILQNEYNKKEEERERVKREELRKIRLQAQQNAYKEEQDYLNRIDELIEQNYQNGLTDKDREIRDVEDKYFELETKANGNAQQLLIIEEAKKNDINNINLKYSKLEQDEKDRIADLEKKEEEDKKDRLVRDLEAEIQLKTTTIDRKVEILNKERDLELQNKDLTENQKLLIEQQYTEKIKNLYTEKDNHEKKIDDEKKKRNEDIQNAIQEMTLNSFSVINGFAELWAGEDENRKKKAFKINKAYELASATLSGLKGVQNAYTTAQSSPITVLFPGYPYVAAGLAGAFAGLQIAKIARTEYKGGGSLGSTPSGGGGGGAPTAQAIPQTNLFGTGGTESRGGQLQPVGEQNISVTTSISVSEISDVQSKVTKYKEIGTL